MCGWIVFGVCVCVRVRACVRACVCVCVRSKNVIPIFLNNVPVMGHSSSSNVRHILLIVFLFSVQ